MLTSRICKIALFFLTLTVFSFHSRLTPWLVKNNMLTMKIVPQLPNSVIGKRFATRRVF